VVLKEGSGDIRELERVINQKTQVHKEKSPENHESGFRFFVWKHSGDPERPGEI
jgi:hypothetical protein